MLDIIIKNGTVIDGTGKKGIVADVGIEKGKIAEIGKIGVSNLVKTIDATGKTVCPGFIDILDHSDNFWTIFTIPRLDSKVFDGVTTIIGGNCGTSLAPVSNQGSIEAMRKWVDIDNVNINWQGTKDFFLELNKKKIGLNFGTLIGHETLRRGLLGDEVRKITEEEVEIIGRMLSDGLQAGAFGLSTGLVFSHAKMTTLNELKFLADILKSSNSYYASHIRGEAEELLPSINETIHIGREMKVSIEISHLKAVGKKYWPDMQRAIDMIDVANEDGVNINFDIYPYDTTGSVLYILLPDWVSNGGRKIMIARLKDLSLREKIINEMKSMNYDYNNIVISICPRLKEAVGRKITDIAVSQEVSIEEAIIELLISANGHVIVFDEGILSEENIKISLRSPYSIIASGDAAYNIEYVRMGELVHPRCFGTFSRVLGKYVREEKILSLEEAIKKMTSLPAQKIGIKDRGILQSGNCADVVIFDQKTIIDKATYSNPYQYSKGIEHVIINGKIVIDNFEHTGELAGKVLKKR
ncbi:MAG: D-aminoacylase [Candidatus Pacebacteria bacterium]|nr:D-aminoacylase [Candidatus Paceibacterota bacterium]